MSEKRKSVVPRPPKRPSRAPARTKETARPKKESESKAPPATGRASFEAEALASRLAAAEEEIGRMLVELTRTQERARAAEAAAEGSAAQSADERVAALVEERDALKEAMREAATILLRAITPGAKRVPPPLPPQPKTSVVDVSEIAEMVESLRPPPTPHDA